MGWQILKLKSIFQIKNNKPNYQYFIILDFKSSLRKCLFSSLKREKFDMYYIQGSYCQQDLIFYRDQYHIITGKSSKND